MQACCAFPGRQGYGDLLDGEALAVAGIPLTPNDTFGTTATVHLGRGTGVFEPDWMFEHHRNVLEGKL